MNQQNAMSHSQAHLFSVVKARKIIIEQPQTKTSFTKKAKIIKTLIEFDERLILLSFKK